MLGGVVGLLVASLLDAVTDNGGLTTLGDKALVRARDKLKELEQDTRFKPVGCGTDN